MMKEDENLAHNDEDATRAGMSCWAWCRPSTNPLVTRVWFSTAVCSFVDLFLKLMLFLHRDPFCWIVAEAPDNVTLCRDVTGEDLSLNATQNSTDDVIDNNATRLCLDILDLPAWIPIWLYLPTSLTILAALLVALNLCVLCGEPDLSVVTQTYRNKWTVAYSLYAVTFLCGVLNLSLIGSFHSNQTFVEDMAIQRQYCNYHLGVLFWIGVASLCANVVMVGVMAEATSSAFHAERQRFHLLEHSTTSGGEGFPQPIEITQEVPRHHFRQSPRQ